jgi:hypothetical protein
MTAMLYPPLPLARSTVSVVVDVEEEFDWSKPFSSESQGVEAISWINLGHTVLAAFGIVPAYLLTYPVATSAIAGGLFRELLATGGCEIGAQLHPWVTPPIEEAISDFHSYPSNLPVDLERRKNDQLIAAIEATTGARPRIYKAGRYGLDLSRADMLAGLGFQVDTSVMPYHDFGTMGGGPDFFGLPDGPFWLDGARTLLGLPSTQGLVGLLSAHLPDAALRQLYTPGMTRLRVPGVLARLGLVERLRLSPEGFSLDAARRLIDARVARGPAAFVLSFHSPSLRPGCTPYVRDQAELGGFLDTLYDTLDHLVRVVGAAPRSVLDLHAEFSTMARPEPAHA